MGDAALAFEQEPDISVRITPDYADGEKGAPRGGGKKQKANKKNKAEKKKAGGGGGGGGGGGVEDEDGDGKKPTWLRATGTAASAIDLASLPGVGDWLPKALSAGIAPFVAPAGGYAFDLSYYLGDAPCPSCAVFAGEGAAAGGSRREREHERRGDDGREEKRETKQGLGGALQKAGTVLAGLSPLLLAL